MFRFMKTSSVIAAIALTGIIAGTAGYQIGLRRTPQSAASVETTPPRTNAGTERRIVLNPTDLTKLRAELDGETEPLKRFNHALKNMEAWVNADPKGALAWLRSQQPSGRRDEVIHRALQQYASNNPQEAAEWAKDNLTGIDLNNTLIRICEQWSRTNGREAAEWTSALPPSHARDAALEGLTFAWASQDPAAALEYLKASQVDPTLASILRYAAYAGWAKTDPVNAVRGSLESSRVFNDPGQFANTLANWATIDVAAAGKWLLENPLNPTEKTLAAKELAGIYANHSPQAGIAWINQLEGADKKAALGEFADGWASSDPSSAAQWAATLPAGSLDDDAVAKILHGFLSDDHAAFEKWRDSLTDGPLKQQALKVAAGEPGE